MGFMDKFLNIMRLNSDDDEDFYDDEELYDRPEEVYDKPAKKSRSFRRKKAEEPSSETSLSASETGQQAKSSSKITPMRPSRKTQGGSASMEVCVIKPTSVEDAREITETLLNNRTVVLNLEGIDLDGGQRIIDFTSGSCYAVRGNLQKISSYIFIASPASVDISGDFLSIMDAFDASSLQMDI